MEKSQTLNRKDFLKLLSKSRSAAKRKFLMDNCTPADMKAISESCKNLLHKNMYQKNILILMVSLPGQLITGPPVIDRMIVVMTGEKNTGVQNGMLIPKVRLKLFIDETIPLLLGPATLNWLDSQYTTICIYLCNVD